MLFLMIVGGFKVLGGTNIYVSPIRLACIPNPTSKAAGYRLATTQLPPGYRLAALATIGNQAVAAPQYL